MSRPILRLITVALVWLTGLSPALAQSHLASAVFAGGCFWSMQHDMAPIPGVVSTEVGYTGGHVSHPSYEDVTTETTGHYEAVKVTYDPAKLSYAALVEHYWRRIDPTDAGGAFCDRGASYRSVIFVATPDERRIAEASKAVLANGRFKGHVATQILPAATFWPAEAYHQHYAEKNPINYFSYRAGCGKDARLHQIWGDEAMH